MISCATRTMIPLNTDKRNEPWAVRIRSTYGEFADFYRRFGVGAQMYCLENVKRAVWLDLPGFARIIGAYGQREVESLIGLHITDAITNCGEETAMSATDVENAARQICLNVAARTLRFTSIFAFFQLFKCGEFEIYGALNTRKLMDAFKKFTVSQRAKEDRIADELEQYLQNERRKEWASKGVTYEEYARMRGEKQDSILRSLFGRKAAVV